MWLQFCKASAVSLAAYILAILLGYWLGFWFTLAAIPVFQVSWALFCAIRIVQSRRPEDQDREGYGFALGGLVSSCALFLTLAIFTQAV